MKDGQNLVIIDNTNTQSWEMRAYIELGARYGYKMHLFEPDTDWKFKPGILSKKNSHGVPKLKIEIMLDRYEKNISIDKLLALWNLNVDLVSHDTVDDEIYNSESEEDEQLQSKGEVDESQETEINTDPKILNPEVNEFVPETFKPLDEDINLETQVNDIDELSNLVQIFPHLTPEEVTEMYESQSISMTLDPNFAITLQNYFGSPAPPEYLQKLPQDQMLSLDISLNVAKIIFTIWQQNVLSKLNDEKLLHADNGADQYFDGINKKDFPEMPQRTTTTAPKAKTVLAPNATAYYEKQMLDSALQVKIFDTFSLFIFWFTLGQS